MFTLVYGLQLNIVIHFIVQNVPALAIGDTFMLVSMLFHPF